MRVGDWGRQGIRLVVFDNRSALRKLLVYLNLDSKRDPTYKIQEAKHYNRKEQRYIYMH